MSHHPLIIERMFDAPAPKVWDALTINEQMQKWYFDLADFKPVVGFEFSFTGKTEQGKEYLHRCKITEVVAGRKLAYSWCYDGFPGKTIVSFELSEAGEKTKLKLTHDGLETLASGGPDFARENFAAGWTSILDQSLKPFLEESTVRA